MGKLEDSQKYLANPAFHQFIKCPRTGLRVSFSEAGPGSYPDSDANSTYPVLFFCLPSVPSRYLAGPHLKLYAEHYGVRVVAIDRPGAGGTEPCELKDRVRITSEMTQSILEHLNITPAQVSLVSHSAGIIYALDLVARSSFFSTDLPSLYATSPWVPTKNTPLRFVPPLLVTNSHVLIPKLLPVLQGIAKSFAFSAALFTTPSSSEPWPVPERLRPQTEERYRPRPPYHTDHTLRPLSLSQTAVEQAMFSEPMGAMSQEYTLCLGRGQGGINEKWYEESMRSISIRSAEQGRKVNLEVFWASNDGMISKKARSWFDTLACAHPETIAYDAVPLEGAAHDDPAFFAETVGAIFEQVRNEWNAKQL